METPKQNPKKMPVFNTPNYLQLNQRDAVEKSQQIGEFKKLVDKSENTDQDSSKQYTLQYLTNYILNQREFKYNFASTVLTCTALIEKLIGCEPMFSELVEK